MGTIRILSVTKTLSKIWRKLKKHVIDNKTHRWNGTKIDCVGDYAQVYFYQREVFQQSNVFVFLGH